ncbi:MAG: hypothetical protein R2713_19835 [Ilumatobacteraceae bacterium]
MCDRWLLNERVGVLNLGQEGLIGVGAVFAVISVQSWGWRARGWRCSWGCAARP